MEKKHNDGSATTMVPVELLDFRKELDQIARQVPDNSREGHGLTLAKTPVKGGRSRIRTIEMPPSTHKMDHYDGVTVYIQYEAVGGNPGKDGKIYEGHTWELRKMFKLMPKTEFEALGLLSAEEEGNSPVQAIEPVKATKEAVYLAAAHGINIEDLRSLNRQITKPDIEAVIKLRPKPESATKEAPKGSGEPDKGSVDNSGDAPV